MPLETHSPQTLTEIQFFLLETKTYLQNCVTGQHINSPIFTTGTVSNKTAAANMSTKYNPYIIHKSLLILLLLDKQKIWIFQIMITQRLL